MSQVKARRRFTAPSQSERYTGNVLLTDGSGATCMHKRLGDSDKCRQHICPADHPNRIHPLGGGMFVCFECLVNLVTGRSPKKET